MPFVQQIPREFNRENIEAISSGLQGVYGLFKANQWVYVGRGDIRERLLAHLNGDNACITRMAPTHYVDEVINNEPALRERERQLITELDPPCNRRAG